jgi:hypothetical protein
MNKICVFCGKPPENKNKEHILPQWLLKMTGDPNRIVKFGYNHLEEKEIIFNWKNLTVPACTKCNENYGKLEGEVGPIVEKLSKKTEINSNEAIKLLDWLDKVRIGLWINYYYLEKNKAQINPRLFIENRIGRKDRFMQIQFLESKKESEGLNAFGVETLSFQFNPSCFGLRINNILILNGSNDFIISENCGFPFPKKIESVENGMLSLKDWEYNRTVSKKISGLKLLKGVLTIMQPIHTEMNYETNYFSDSYLIQNCIDREKRIGTLFRFSDDDVIPIYDLNAELYFESVKGKDVKIIGELIAKVYEGQNAFLSKIMSDKEETFEKTIELNKKHIEFYKEYHKTLPNTVYN